MARASLVDDADFPSSSGGKGKSGGGSGSGGGGGAGLDKAQIVKLVVAVVLLLGAGALIAWSMGVFDRPPRIDPATAAQQEAEYQQQQKELEPLLKRPDAVESGA